MKTTILTLALLVTTAALAPAQAIEICGNPCEEGYVWTDKNMGMCIPAPPPAPTS